MKPSEKIQLLIDNLIMAVLDSRDGHRSTVDQHQNRVDEAWAAIMDSLHELDEKEVIIGE